MLQKFWIQLGAFYGLIICLLSFRQNHNYRKLFSEPTIKFTQTGFLSDVWPICFGWVRLVVVIRLIFGV